jgi:CheY-like chemotaxis protein
MAHIRILLAEDDEDDRFFFRQAVLDSGIEAELTAVADGTQLIDLLLDRPEPLTPDVIFLDLNMPGINGKAALQEIRRQEKLAAVPVIILSTSIRLKDIDDTYRDGANRYISKILFYSDSVKWMTILLGSDWQIGLAIRSRESFAFID